MAPNSVGRERDHLDVSHEVDVLEIQHLMKEHRYPDVIHPVNSQDEGEAAVSLPTAPKASMGNIPKATALVERETELTASETSSITSSVPDDDAVSLEQVEEPSSSFMLFRINYVFVTLAIMLADGLQGTYYLLLA